MHYFIYVCTLFDTIVDLNALSKLRGGAPQTMMEVRLRGTECREVRLGKNGNFRQIFRVDVEVVEGIIG